MHSLGANQVNRAAGRAALTALDAAIPPLRAGDLFVFCTDGIFEALNEEGAEFGAARLAEVVNRVRERSARAIVDAIFEETASFRGTRPQGDDMTAVAVKITT